MAIKMIRYKVEGAGEFPVDMLRFDQAHPYNESDSYLCGDAHVRRTIEIEGLRCTPRRWESFMWKVVA